jgi:hypothetical protein
MDVMELELMNFLVGFMLYLSVLNHFYRKDGCYGTRTHEFSGWLPNQPHDNDW